MSKKMNIMKKFGAIAVILCCNTMVLTAAPFPNGRNISRNAHFEQDRFTGESFNASKLQDPFGLSRETDNTDIGQLRGMQPDPGDPGLPVGDSLWFLAVSGLTYAVYLFSKKRKANIVK
jgi:hypothetical protein